MDVALYMNICSIFIQYFLKMYWQRERVIWYNKRSFISIQNLCYIIDEIITQQQNGVFLASDDEFLGTSKLIELIAKNLDKKVYLIKIPLFESFLKVLKLEEGESSEKSSKS